MHLSVRNFGSWRKLEFPLNDQGTVCLKGFTGSGKSTIFKALHWCLFGATPDSGTKADEIRGSKKPTRVTLRMHKDGYDYTLSRYRGHPLYKNKLAFHGYGLPDSDADVLVKDIQDLVNTFLGVSPRVFASTVYFSQRNFHLFHSLSDSGKKEWLESITYGTLFPICESVSREGARSIDRALAEAQGMLRGYEESLASLLALQKQRRAYNAKELADLHARRDKIRARLNVFSRLLKKRDGYIEDSASARNARHALSNDYEREKLLVVAYGRTDACPTCGQPIDSQSRLAKLQSHKLRMYDLRSKLREIDARISSLSDYISDLSGVEKRHRRLTDRLASVSASIKQCRDLMRDETVIEQLRKDIEAVKHLIHTHQNDYQYWHFWVRGFGFSGLRFFVLQRAATYLLAQIQHYAYTLMANAMNITMDFTNNNLVFRFNGRSYGTLSGGERQTIDLCTGLALRDLAEAYNKCDMNLLILDEPFEGLDSRLTSAAQTLLRSYEKSSVFFITHRPVEARFDRVYTVTKREHGSRLSH